MANETKTINLTTLKTLQALEKTIRRAAQEAEQVYCEDADAADTVIEVHAALSQRLVGTTYGNHFLTTLDNGKVALKFEATEEQAMEMIAFAKKNGMIK